MHIFLTSLRKIRWLNAARQALAADSCWASRIAASDPQLIQKRAFALETGLAEHAFAYSFVG